MTQKKPLDYCYLARNNKCCVKSTVSKKHLPFYECDLCIWRIHSEDPRHLKVLKKLYEKYYKRD